MTIAITGATGFVGSAVTNMALARGLDLRALARKRQASRPGVAWLEGDLFSKDTLATLMHGAEAVLHIAGVVNTPDPEGFEQGNVVGTLNVIEAAQAAGVPRLIFVSSLAAREPDLSVYGASKLRAERLVRASPLDWTIVRPPTVYGPGDKDVLQLFRAAKWGFVPVPEKGRSSIIHVDDLARLLLTLLPSTEETTHHIFEPDDGRAEGWSHHELAEAVGAAVGRKARVLGLSRTALERAAKVDRLFRGKKAQMTPDRASYMSHPDWVVSTAARVPTEIWQPEVETCQGLRDTATWYRQAKWL